ncbi:hypothetical protein CBF45_11905 [Bordetella sp. J329]|nr:hypothetical protein CBF45_11905 [Bordetella sp. J329]
MCLVYPNRYIYKGYLLLARLSTAPEGANGSGPAFTATLDIRKASQPDDPGFTYPVPAFANAADAAVAYALSPAQAIDTAIGHGIDILATLFAPDPSRQEV